MSKKESNKEGKLNKRLKISFIIFLISGILALIIILNKGVIFGKRLISITNAGTAEVTHSIQLVAGDPFLRTETDTTELMVTIDGVDVTEGIEITSSDETVVSIDGMTAKAGATGTAIITAKSTEYDIESQATIDVVKPINKLSLSAEFSQIAVGEQTTMSYTLNPKTTDVRANIVYESSDENIATVDSSGIVTGISAGSVTIKGTDKITGISNTFKITVK